MPFDSLKATQPTVAEEIENAYLSGFLPQSILLSGQKGSSRLTGALDLAFTILDDYPNRELLRTGEIVYLPSRNLEAEFACALKMFSSQRTNASRIFLIQCIRKILFQYHSSLLGSMDSKQKGLFSTAEEISSMLYDYEKSREYSEKEIDSLVSFLSKLVTSTFINKGKKSSGVSIEDIRSIQDWFSSGSDEKIAIFEDIENSTEGAKNSLLKVLEEPVEHCHLILISSNPQKLLPTILSRLRKFNFPSLSERNIASFIKKRFNLYQDYSSFEAFYFDQGAGESEKNALEKAVTLFSSALLEKNELTNEDKDGLYSSLDRLGAYGYFRRRVADNISSAMLSGKILPIRAKEIMDIMNRWILNCDTYNLSQRAALDGILREA